MRASEEIEDYRALKAGWDGERAAAPSTRSIDAALLWLWRRNAINEIAEPSLHVDGTVIVEIGSSTIHFTDEGGFIWSGEPLEPQASAP